jgi:hypothetical protein
MQYDVFAGLKGKIVNNVSYNIRGSYINERNKALYRTMIIVKKRQTKIMPMGIHFRLFMMI